MNRASLSVAATRRTRPSSLSAPCPALSPERVSPVVFPLAGRLPSTASAAPPWALFGSFSGSTRPSDFSRSSITGLRLWPSPHDPPLHHDRRVTVVGSPGGIAPPGSHGSRRDSLPSPGSSHRPVSSCGPGASERIGRAGVLAARSTIDQSAWCSAVACTSWLPSASGRS